MSEPQTTLPYATPGARAPRVLVPSAILMATALGLVVLGGCFTIGILALNSPNVGSGSPATTLPAKTGEQYVLEVVLYLLAFACFGGAASLIVTGVKWLRQARA